MNNTNKKEYVKATLEILVLEKDVLTVSDPTSNDRLWVDLTDFGGMGL